MRSPRARGSVAVVALAIASTWSLRAADAWTALGVGAGAAGATSVAAAPAPTASLSSGAVVVRWSPVPLAETYRARRFDPSGSPVAPSGGCATPTTATTCVESPAPSGTWTYAIDATRRRWNATTGPTGAPVVIAGDDTTPPIVSTVAVGLAEGTSSGWIRPSGSYRVFASADDDGPGTSGLASVRADVSAIVGAGSWVDLAPGGPWSIAGETFGWRSPAFVASSNLAEATERTFTVTATDGAGNSGSRGGKTTVDTTAPTGLDIQTVPAGTTGRADAGDRIVFTFSEAVDPASLLPGWTGGSAATVTVRIADGGTGADVLTVWDAANTSAVALGSVVLDRTDYVSAAVIFGTGSAPSTMTISGATVTVTLGPGSPSSRTVSGTGGGTMVWTPSAGATDRAGNACSSAPRSESGARDREF